MFEQASGMPALFEADCVLSLRQGETLWMFATILGQCKGLEAGPGSVWIVPLVSLSGISLWLQSSVHLPGNKSNGTQRTLLFLNKYS